MTPESAPDPLAPLFACIAQALSEALSDPDCVLQLVHADDESRRSLIEALMPRVRERACQLYAARDEWVIIE